ncbi:MAG TPA: BolA family protein [Alphaproteobacteria bacterium]|nr:BolA family protein [Alphaproteobacteria bacterium]
MSLKNRIECKLNEAFSPSYLRVEDESHLHVGHQGHRPGGESHFHVTIVSAAFQGLNRIQRHQRIYVCLEEELRDGIHALSLKIISPEEAEGLTELA